LAKRELAKLEAVLDAKVHTLSASDCKELAQFAPKPQEKILEYEIDPPSEQQKVW
jgi:hypothetical protein